MASPEMDFSCARNCQMAAEMELSCAVSIPTNKQVTTLVLLAQRVKKRWWWKKHYFFPIMTVDLRSDQSILTNDSMKVFRDCRVTPNLQAIRELDVNCSVKMKVKRGNKTIFKRALDASLLIQCLKEPKNASKAIHIAFDAFSPNPVSVTVKENAKEEQECEELNIVACSSFEPQLPQKVLAEGDSVKKDSIEAGKVEIKLDVDLCNICGKREIEVDVEVCYICGKRELPRAIPILHDSLPPVPEMPSKVPLPPTPPPPPPSASPPQWYQFLEETIFFLFMHGVRVCMRRLRRCIQTKGKRVYARHKKPIKRIRWVFGWICGRTYPGRVYSVPVQAVPLSLPVTNRLPSSSAESSYFSAKSSSSLESVTKSWSSVKLPSSSDESVSSTTECQFPILKSVARVLLRQKARGVCKVYCTHKKFVPRKMKIEVKSYVYKTAFFFKKLITFHFDTRWNTYKEKKMHFIETDRRRNSLGFQRWTSEPAAMLLNRLMRHKNDKLIRVTVTWDYYWADRFSRVFVPMSWFLDQVWEDALHRREFVFRILTQEHLSSQQEDVRGIVTIKKSIEEENVILAVDDEPLISNVQDSEQEEAKYTEEQLVFNGEECREKETKKSEMNDSNKEQWKEENEDEPLISNVQKSDQEEAKCKEEQLVFNGEECREKETKEMTESEMNDSNKEELKEENEDTPNNSEVDKEASNTSEKGQEDQKTDREGEGNPAAPAHAVIPGMVKRVKRNLVKMVCVALTIVVVLVAADALLPELPED